MGVCTSIEDSKSGNEITDIAGRIPLGQNIHSKSGVVTDGTYIGFMILTFCGAVLAWALVDARQVERADGSRVVLMKNPSWRSEFLGLWEVLRTDTWVIFLWPMFFASNWFYTYQFNDGKNSQNICSSNRSSNPYQSTWHFSTSEPDLSIALFTGLVRSSVLSSSATRLILSSFEEAPKQKPPGALCSFLLW